MNKKKRRKEESLSCFKKITVNEKKTTDNLTWRRDLFGRLFSEISKNLISNLDEITISSLDDLIIPKKKKKVKKKV